MYIFLEVLLMLLIVVQMACSCILFSFCDHIFSLNELCICCKGSFEDIVTYTHVWVNSANLYFSKTRSNDAKCLFGEIIADKGKMINTC